MRSDQCSQSLIPIPPAKRLEIQRADQLIASHSCLHSGTQVPPCAGNSYFLVIREWHSDCVNVETRRSQCSIMVNVSSAVLRNIRHRSCPRQSANAKEPRMSSRVLVEESASASLSAYGKARSTVEGTPLNLEELRKIHAYWRACNYLALGMIYLQANPLLKEPL